MFCIVARGDSVVVASSRTIRFDGDSNEHLFSAELCEFGDSTFLILLVLSAYS